MQKFLLITFLIFTHKCKNLPFLSLELIYRKRNNFLFSLHVTSFMQMVIIQLTFAVSAF